MACRCRVGWVALTLAIACGPSVGEGPGNSGGATEGGTSSDAQSVSDGTSPSPVTGSATVDPTGAPELLCEGSEASCHAYAASCTDPPCGGYGWLDESGCVRDPCSWDEDCGQGQRCYRPSFFAPQGCLASGFGCEDSPEEQACICGGTADCNTGIGVCIEEADYPPPTVRVDEGDLDNDCAPNDGAAFTVRLGGVGTCAPDEVRLALTFYEPAGAGLFRFDNTTQRSPSGDGHGTMVLDDAVLEVVAAEVIVTELVIDNPDGSGTAHGSYVVWLAQEEHFEGTFQTVYCATPPLCG